ncbi:MAG TPA: helix-turn-helix domain-containing protein [Limnobacter sp.]|uniref:helix-turn-helix domain-containing protein n=1 Tax=Limnobacter sp. TaxID=2003368 RepID=UPI002EDA974F
MSENFLGAINQLLNAKYGGNRSKMASDLGFSPQVVAAWVSGKSVPRDENLEIIAKAMDMSANELLNGTQFIKPDETELRLQKIERRLEKLEKGYLAKQDSDPLIDQVIETLRGASVDQQKAILQIVKTLRGGD